MRGGEGVKGVCMLGVWIRVVVVDIEKDKVERFFED